MADSVVTFQNITKSYPSYYHITGGIKTFLFHLPESIRELRQRRVVLENISLDIHQGESFGFVGRNGAGKSTLLGLIAGVLQPDKGSITVHGRVSPLLELGAGFHPELTGRENIMLNGVLLGLTRAQVREHLDEIIEFSELQDFIEQPVRTYSSGMYAKLGFSVVATLKPEILLVDEILSVGDLAFVRKCNERFQKFRGDPKVTIVLVSHALETITKVCDRAAWIDKKQVRIVGPATDVVKEYINANRPNAAVPEAVTPVPTHILAGTTLLNCTLGPAKLPLRLSSDMEGLTIQATLLRFADRTPICEWSLPPQAVLLSYAAGDWTLETLPGFDDLPQMTLPREDLSSPREDDAASPLALRLRGELHGKPYTPEVWIAVAAQAAARQTWERQRGEALLQLGRLQFPRAPFWPLGVTVRIVARNIVSHDAVGNFAVGVAGMLTACGVPARLYAYQSCASLTGLVSSIGDLEDDMQPQDILFYNYSIEDEFLSPIVALPGKKLLYYHNVTPSVWFRDYNPAFADVLDRSRGQYALFSLFDGVLANSRYSLAEVKKYLPDAPLRGVCPPCIDPGRLARLTPVPVDLPDENFLLWVGRIAPHKRPELALEIFHVLSRRVEDLHFVMVGGGRRDFPDYARKIEEIIEAMPEAVRERLHFYEALSDAQLAFMYSRARLLLCTSAHEGFCLPVLEARTFGLPVATCAIPAVMEHLDQTSGCVIPDSPGEAATAIAAHLADGGKRPAAPTETDGTVACILEGLLAILAAKPRQKRS